MKGMIRKKGKTLGSTISRTIDRTISRKTGKRQNGFTLVEMIITTGIIGIFAVLVIPRAAGLFSSNNLVIAQGEIESVIRAAQKYRSAPVRAGLYTGITITTLSGGAYGVEPFTTGVNQNAFGETISIVSANSNSDATLTYVTPSAGDCQNLVDNLTGRAGVKSTPACTASTLSFNLE